MLHLGAVLPNLVFTADAHYHQLVDDIIIGGPMQYKNGAIAVPTGPGLGVEIDRDKLGKYAELYKFLGGSSMTAIRRDLAGSPWCPTPAGPIRLTVASSIIELKPCRQNRRAERRRACA